MHEPAQQVGRCQNKMITVADAKLLVIFSQSSSCHCRGFRDYCWMFVRVIKQPECKPGRRLTAAGIDLDDELDFLRRLIKGLVETLERLLVGESLCVSDATVMCASV